MDLLIAFIDYHTKACEIAWFDEEGAEFSLVITPYSLFVIEEKDKPILYDFSEMAIENVEKEFIEDIERDLIGWSNFITDDDPNEITIHKDKIGQKIGYIKRIYEVRQINAMVLE